MFLKTVVNPFNKLEVVEDARLKGFNKAVKFDNKLRVSPAIFFLIKETPAGWELDGLLRYVSTLDLDDPGKVKENMKLLPESLTKKSLLKLE